MNCFDKSHCSPGALPKRLRHLLFYLLKLRAERL
jgi:hypothetical protein